MSGITRSSPGFQYCVCLYHDCSYSLDGFQDDQKRGAVMGLESDFHKLRERSRLQGQIIFALQNALKECQTCPASRSRSSARS